MPTSIVRSLADSGIKHAQRAVELFVREEFADFYLSAGIALESAMKARLARENVATSLLTASSGLPWRSGRRART